MQKNATRPIIIVFSLLVLGILGIIYVPSLLKNANRSRASATDTMTFSSTSAVTATVGQNLDPINILIASADKSISGVDVSVTFNSNYLELVSVNPVAASATTPQTGSSFKTFAPVITTNNIDTFDATGVVHCANGTGDPAQRTKCTERGLTNPGTIEFGAVTFNTGLGTTTPPIAPPSNFILASLTFKAKAAGTSSIAFRYTPQVPNATTDSNIVTVDGSGNAVDVLGLINGPINVTVSTTTVPTVTNTPIPPSPTRTNTPIPPSPTRTNTPIPPTATRTPTPSPTRTPTPSPTTPVSALCTCQPTTNVCANTSGSITCGFNKFTSTELADIVYGDPTATAVNGVFPIKCNTRTSVAYTVAPDTNDKNSFCQRPLRTKGDADGDGLVSNNDYLYQLRASIGASLPKNITVDFNGDTRVDTDDRAIVVKSRNPN